MGARSGPDSCLPRPRNLEYEGWIDRRRVLDFIIQIFGLENRL